MTRLFDRHQGTLDRALKALAERDFWSPYPEVPSGKIYGETAKADGLAAFDARLSASFSLAGIRSNTPLATRRPPTVRRSVSPIPPPLPKRLLRRRSRPRPPGPPHRRAFGSASASKSWRG